MNNRGEILTLSKIDLEPYKSDPIKYNSFSAIFNRSINTVVCSDDDKLVYLLRCTCGPSKDVHVVHLKMPLICVP